MSNAILIFTRGAQFDNYGSHIINEPDYLQLSSKLVQERRQRFKLLLDSGAEILDIHITNALDCDECIDLLIDYGLSHERVGRIVVKKLFEHTNSRHLGITKKCIKNHIDLNQVIMELIDQL